MNEPLLRRGTGMARRGGKNGRPGSQPRCGCCTDRRVQGGVQDWRLGSWVVGDSSHQNEGFRRRGCRLEGHVRWGTGGEDKLSLHPREFRCPWNQQETGREGLKLRGVQP